MDRFTKRFFFCGGCEHYHRFGWTGDCRDDSERFTTSYLEEQYGDEGDGWVEVDERTGK
jgi:hypothetical protein